MKPTKLIHLGLTPALFEAMAATAQRGDVERIKLNKRAIRREIKIKKKKQKVKGLRP